MASMQFNELAASLLARDCGHDVSLATGAAGLALVHHEIARILPGRGHEQRSHELKERALNALATDPFGPTLYHGALGIAWCHAALSSNDGSDQAEILSTLSEGINDWSGPMDLVHGLVGVGVYAAEFAHLPAGNDLARKIVRILQDSAECSRDGLCWAKVRTNSDCVSKSRDLGVAHGSAGIVALLARYVEQGIEVNVCRRLLEGAAGWLLLRAHVNANRLFGAFDDTPPETFTRCAWCYGDLGIVTSLFWARSALGWGWRAGELDNLANRLLRRDFDDWGADNAGICHGVSGALILSMTLASLTSNGGFARVVEYWLSASHRYIDGHDLASEDVGLASGLGGLALALASAYGSPRTNWHRIFLLPRSAPLRSVPQPEI